MTNNKQDDAIKALDEMLHNLKKPKFVPSKDIIKFYENVEEVYDNSIEILEEILLQDIDDEEKFQELKKISELLELNIF